MRRSPQRRIVTSLLAALLITGGLAGCGADGPDDTLDDFLAGWAKNDLAGVGFVTAAGAGIPADDVMSDIKDMSGELSAEPPRLKRTGDPARSGETATATVALTWTLTGGVTWSYGSDGWRVVWEPGVVHPELTAGDRLLPRRVAAPRGAVLDGTGAPIVTPRPVVTVGVTPEKLGDLPATVRALDAAFRSVGVTLDLSGLPKRVDEADPGAFLELVTLRRADYDKIRDRVRPLDGTVFREEQRDLAPTRAFARALLGSADPATRDDITANPDTVRQGDVVGHGGLQQRYDATLRGTAGMSVVIERQIPEDPAAEPPVVFTAAPVPGTPVRTTLDADAQNAADRALAAQKQPSSMVAVRVSDGAVLAVANGPDGGTVNTALTGRVPPGSTFKMVSALGLLQKKAITADTVVDCPKTRTVDGRTFKNSHDMALGKVPFHVGFAKSCNTAFVNLAPKLGADGLAAAGGAVGLGGAWDIGAEAYSGTVSAGGSATELAAAAFGQGTTTVSPLAMASATAAVARGQFKQPRLVTEPAPAQPAADGPPLGDEVTGPLRAMMREVVTGGTGTALKDVPGGPVHGKTGTAEFESGSAETHSWFIGWQGDVAFAVMVEKGGAGSDAAVPIAGRFLTALND